MNTVGVFAGRGDIIIAMGMALLVGGWIGYQFRGVKDRLMARFNK